MIAYIFVGLLTRQQDENTFVCTYVDLVDGCRNEEVAQAKFKSLFSRSDWCEVGWKINRVFTQIDLDREWYEELGKYFTFPTAGKVAYFFADGIHRFRSDGVMEAGVFHKFIMGYENIDDTYDAFCEEFTDSEKQAAGWKFINIPVYIEIKAAGFKNLGQKIHEAEVVSLFKT